MFIVNLLLLPFKIMLLPFRLLFGWLSPGGDSYDSDDEEFMFWHDLGHKF